MKTQSAKQAATVKHEEKDRSAKVLTEKKEIRKAKTTQVSTRPPIKK